MRYRAEAFEIDSDQSVADLLHWDTRQAAQVACEYHALERLRFSTHERGVWVATSGDLWFRIVASQE